jgi:DNA-binding NtrC family response regulator
MDNMKILLVDDEERFLITTKKLMERKGITVFIALSGTEALDKLQTEDIPVVILDVKMPGMDGVETLKAIKARFPLVEVIMLTGHINVNSAIEGLKGGAVDYLMKPVDIDDLLFKAEEAFAKRKTIEEKIRTMGKSD